MSVSDASLLADRPAALAPSSRRNRCSAGPRPRGRVELRRRRSSVLPTDGVGRATNRSVDDELRICARARRVRAVLAHARAGDPAAARPRASASVRTGRGPWTSAMLVTTFAIARRARRAAGPAPSRRLVPAGSGRQSSQPVGHGRGDHTLALRAMAAASRRSRCRAPAPRRGRPRPSSASSPSGLDEDVERLVGQLEAAVRLDDGVCSWTYQQTKFHSSSQKCQSECDVAASREREDVMSLPDVRARRLVGHPALEIAAVGIATHRHACGSRSEVEREAVAVVRDDAVRKRPAHAAAIRTPNLDQFAGEHRRRV